MHPDNPSTDHIRFTAKSAFPDARKSPALSEEDAFMQTHGGHGSRTIYIIVMGIEAGVIALARAPGSTRKLLKRLWVKGTGRTGAQAAASSVGMVITHEK